MSFFSTAGISSQAPGGGIFGGGGILGDGNGGGGGGGGWSWADDLANIIRAGGEAFERSAGAVTGHQGQYTQQTYYPPVTTPTTRTNATNSSSLSLDRALNGVLQFAKDNMLLVVAGLVGYSLLKRDPDTGKRR